MDTFKSLKKQQDALEQFLDSLEHSETANDVPIKELEEATVAYEEYLQGRDKGKSLEKLKIELEYSEQFKKLNNWQYIILKPAERYLKRIQPRQRQRIFHELNRLLVDPTQVDFKKLAGRADYRLRVGSYRVLIEIDREKYLFIITNIGSRGDIYK